MISKYFLFSGSIGRLRRTTCAWCYSRASKTVGQTTVGLFTYIFILFQLNSFSFLRTKVQQRIQKVDAMILQLSENQLEAMKAYFGILTKEKARYEQCIAQLEQTSGDPVRCLVIWM